MKYVSRTNLQSGDKITIVANIVLKQTLNHSFLCSRKESQVPFLLSSFSARQKAFQGGLPCFSVRTTLGCGNSP